MPVRSILAAVCILLLAGLAPAADNAAFGAETARIHKSQTEFEAEPTGAAGLLSYQGRLTDAEGVPVPDGEYAVEFRLYPVAAGGSPFWQERQAVVTQAGLFAVLLGSVTPLELLPAAAWLGMAVQGGPELAPRLRLAGPALGRDATGLVPDGPDSDGWVRSDSVLFTANQLGIAKGGSGNNLYGSGATRSTQVNLGVSSTTGEVGFQRLYTTVLGGQSNVANRGYATIAGGMENTASGPSATVLGGYQNVASGWRTAILGGYQNVAAGQHSAIPGGWGNRAADSSGFAAGTHGKATHKYSAVLGLRGPLDSTFSIGQRSFTVGAESSYIRRRLRADTVVTGQAYKGAVLADSMLVSKRYVDQMGGGGGDNAWTRSSPADSVIYTVNRLGIARGGANNMLHGSDAARSTHVNLGVNCTTGVSAADRFYNTVPGGWRGVASANHSTVSGGDRNTASGSASAVGGGSQNTASGSYAMVAGGLYNRAAGNYSFATGIHAKATHEFSGVLGFRADSTFSIGQRSFTVGAESSYIRRQLRADTVTARQVVAGLGPSGPAFLADTTVGHGMRIRKPGADGIRVDTAANYGMYIGNAKNNNGVRVEYTMQPGWGAFYTYGPGGDGYRVFTPGGHGFSVSSAGSNGLQVSLAAERGVNVENAGQYGVYANSNNQRGGYFRNNNNSYYALTAWNNTGTGGSVRGAYVQGHVYATGGFQTFLDGGKTGYGLVSPDMEIMVSGSGRLSNGQASINLESSFHQAVSSEVPLKVIVTPNSMCNGVFVADRSTAGFTVRELADGASDAGFDWIAIGRLKGYEQRPEATPLQADEPPRPEAPREEDRPFSRD